MLKWPFLPLAIVLFCTGITVILLPFGIMFGYPWLAISGIFLLAQWSRGRLPNAAQVASTWLCWLGILICLHGILLGADLSIGGAPSSVAELQFGRRVATAGGVLAIVSAILSFAISIRRRFASKNPANS
ncbi:hypothetical protein GC170_05740 [bacterium]|nr:hypothetical protein [bacterium]